jgi:GntR family transcriptional regulator/MocR family aminotransferase
MVLLVTRHARPVSLPLVLAASGAPLRHRVADALIGLLRAGHLRPGDTLPATRALAAELGISRTAVLAAYDELAAAGFVHAVGGSSTVVSPAVGGGGTGRGRAEPVQHLAAGPAGAGLRLRAAARDSGGGRRWGHRRRGGGGVSEAGAAGWVRRAV